MDNYNAKQADFGEMLDAMNESNQVDTPEFKNWFKGSKVVDKQGKPLAVYHGTNQTISNFDTERGGENTKAESAYQGFYFTDSAEVAGMYADQSARTQVPNAPDHEARVEELLAQISRAEDAGDFDTAEELTLEVEDLDIGATQEEPSGQSIMPVYLRIESPLEYDMKGKHPHDDPSGGLAVLIEKAQDSGNDGLVIHNMQDDPEGSDELSTHYIVFDPKQIKSATGNKGTFDPDSDDIGEATDA